MTNFPIKAFNGSIQNQPTQLINARELHQFLQIGRDFSTWIKERIESYGFMQGEDFSPIVGKSPKLFGRPTTEYHITLDMAKELCMLERSELGQQAHRYFIRMEKEAIAARQMPSVNQHAISLTKDRYIELLENENRLLRSQPNPQRKKAPIPLSADEKTQILQLANQGIQTATIAKQLSRSKSSVRAVIREAK